MKTVTVSREDAHWLDELLKDVPLTQDLDLEALAEAGRVLDQDPEYVADYLKGLFVSEIYNAMDEQGINANQLAQRWGKSRQYLSKILNEDRRVNFTIDTIVDLMMQLDRRVELHFPHKRQHTAVIRCVRKPVKNVWESPPARTCAESVSNFNLMAHQPAPEIAPYEYNPAA